MSSTVVVVVVFCLLWLVGRGSDFESFTLLFTCVQIDAGVYVLAVLCICRLRQGMAHMAHTLSLALAIDRSID